MKLSDLPSEDVQVLPADGSTVSAPAPLKLSQLDPVEVQLLQPDEATNSPVTAATTSLIHGAGMNGWGERIGAASKTAMDAITGVNGPLAGGDIQDLIDEYNREHDKLKSTFARAAAAHPKIAAVGNFAGGMTTLGAAGPAAMSTGGLLTTGALQGSGAVDVNSAADIPKAALAAGQGAVTNLAIGKATEAAAPYIGKALKPVGDALSSGVGKVADAIGGSAEGLAEKATGATRAQAEKFVDGTGRELLDRGIVGFGDSPADIAQKANAAMDAAEASKQALAEGELAPAKVDRNTVYSYIRNKINELKGDESQIGLVKKLESKLEDITGVAEENGSEVPLSQSEQIRRGFDKAGKWNSTTDAAEAEANKIVANGYREAGEESANAVSPDAGAAFKEAKTTQHTLIPVAEAAEKRALQLQQSPHGGLLDAAHAGVGATVGGAIDGPIGSVIGAGVGLGAKALRPRYASMAAVSADNLSKLVASTPQAFGKFASVLTSAAARGETSLGATDYILQQTNPEYREQRNKVFSPEEDEQQPWMLTESEENVK